MIGTKKQLHFFLGFFLFLGMKVILAHHIVVLEGAIKPIKSAVSDSTNSQKKDKQPKTIKPTQGVSNQGGVVPFTLLRKDVAEAARWEAGNSVSTNSYTINEVFEPSTLSNVVSLNIYDRNFNVHSFSGTQSLMYGLNFTYENNVNTKRELIGFEYRFKQPDTLKFRYSARARLERDNESQTYYQLGVGVQFDVEKRLNLIGLEYYPVRSGPGHILRIYRAQLVNYNEFQLTERIQQIASFEGNYYTDQQADFVFSTRTEYLLAKSGSISISPIVEGAYGLGSTNRRDAYPYWMASKRVYGGGGLALEIGSNTSVFQVFADATVFGELNQLGFERYTGTMSYRIQNFTTINAGLEVYTIENFYSNVFQLGMVYNFK